MRRKDEASAFIIALGILVILFIMAITFATMMIMESRAARNYNDAALCEDVAYGALEEAINALFRDKYGEDASVVAGSLVLQPYNDDAVDENYDFWGTGLIPENPGSWPGQGTEGNEPFSDSASNTVDLNGDGTNDSKWIYRSLPAGLLGRYAILITDDREARVNVNTAGNLAIAGPTHGSNMGASVTEVSLEALLGLFNERDGSPISAADAETLAEAIILARCTLPGGGSSEAGQSTTDDDWQRDGSPGVAGDRSVDENGVDDDANGTIDDEDGLDEDDEFNSLFALEDTPFALPDEAEFMFMQNLLTALVESATATTITDTSQDWSIDQYQGYLVIVEFSHMGRSGAQIRTIVSNTSDTITVNRDWDPNIDPGDVYRIVVYGTEYTSGIEEIIETILGAGVDLNLSTNVPTTVPDGIRREPSLADCLTTYSAGTIEHPYIDTGQIPAPFSDTYRRYRFGLNQFNIVALNATQVDDLKDILETVGGFSTTDPAKPDPYQFIVNLKDALDEDSTVTDYTVGATTYYGVELRPFITEVMREDVDIPGPDMRAYYFIEFYNPSPDPISVFGWDLDITDGPYPGGGTINLANVSIPGNGFYVIGGENRPYVNTPELGLRRNYDPASPPGDLEISALELTCTNDDPLPDGTIIDKADDFGAFDFITPKSQERHDFKVNQWTDSTAVAGHTFTIGSRSPYTPDGTHPRGFDEIFPLFIVPDYLDKNNSGSIFDEISSVDPINYDINLANLSDLSRLLVTGYSTNPADPALSQKFKDLKDNEASIPAETDIYDSQYRLIKFDSSYANHREVLDYLSVLNPMGDGYDDDGDGTADDDGTQADDLGGPEHRIPGMININTASKEVLMVLPGIDAFESDGVDNDGDASTDESGEAADVIDIVIANRPYTEIGDLFAVNGFNQGSNDVDDDGDGVIDEVDEKEADYIAFGKISNIITTRSNVFTVYCLAQVGIWNDLNDDDIVDPGEFTIFAERELMAIVDRSIQPINVRFQRWLTD